MCVFVTYSLVFHSLEDDPDLTNLTPKNFVNGKTLHVREI